MEKRESLKYISRMLKKDPYNNPDRYASNVKKIK